MSAAASSQARRPAPAAAPMRGHGVASPLPMVAGLACAVASLVLALVVAGVSSAPVIFFGMPLPLVSGGAWWLSLVGYLLTPMGVVAAYGWDAIVQRRAVAADPNFADRPLFGRVLLWTAGISILIGAWHVLNLSVPLSEAWGLS